MIELSVLEARCALTVMRAARDELKERQMMLAQKVLPVHDGDHVQTQTESDALLVLENRIYLLHLVCQKLWIFLHQKNAESTTVVLPTIKPEDLDK